MVAFNCTIRGVAIKLRFTISIASPASFKLIKVSVSDRATPFSSTNSYDLIEHAALDSKEVSKVNQASNSLFGICSLGNETFSKAYSLVSVETAVSNSLPQIIRVA